MRQDVGFDDRILHIGKSERIESLETPKVWGPEGYPPFPLPDKKGKIKRKEVLEFMGKLREQMKGWVERGDYGLIKQVWVLPVGEAKGEQGGAGLLVGLGVEKSHQEGFPHTPLVWMVPIERSQSLESWGKNFDERERAENMRKLLVQRLAGREETTKLGGEGNLVVNLHGWGGNPFYPWTYMAELAAALKKKDVDIQKTVVLSMGTQGSLGTVEGDPRAKDLEMVPDQMEGTLDQIVDALTEEKYGDNAYAAEGLIIERRFWQRLRMVIGHSMGAWASLRWRIKYADKIKSLRGNDDLKVLAMDMVTIGSEPSWEEQQKAKLLLGIEPGGKNVTLLEAPLRGRLVNNLDKILQWEVLRKWGRDLGVIRLIVRSYMGSDREWETNLHEETIINDLPAIVANILMLRKVGSLIQNRAEKKYVRGLVDLGVVLFGAGKKDKILNPRPVLQAIRALGGAVNTETVQHYGTTDIYAGHAHVFAGD